jgi:hypothetical protein
MDGRSLLDQHDSVPLSADISKLLSTLDGSLEGTQEHCALESEVGYSS